MTYVHCLNRETPDAPASKRREPVKLKTARTGVLRWLMEEQWFTVPRPGKHAVIEIRQYAQDGDVIANVLAEDGDDEDAQTMARLIATSPRLYKAVRAVLALDEAQSVLDGATRWLLREVLAEIEQ